MSIHNAFDGLNRNLDCPSHHQLEAKYNKQYGYEHELTTGLDNIDRYPVTVLVDSNDRNFKKDSPGHYTIKLNRTLKNVYSIELIGGKLPGICYNITNNNNLIAFQETIDQVETGKFHSIRVPPGDYTPLVLANAIMTAMNETGDNTYRVTVDPITKKFTIVVVSDDENVSFTGTFNLIFSDRCDFVGDAGFMSRDVVTQDCRGKLLRFEVKDERYGCSRPIYLKGSIGKILGFEPENKTGMTSYTGSFCYDLSPFDYIVLFVNDYDRVHSVNPKVDGSFCVIPLDSVTNSFDTSTRNIDNVRYIKFFYPMIKELNQITIKFVDSCGNIYDFNGSNNALIFEIGCSFGQPILRRPPLIRAPDSATNTC